MGHWLKAARERGGEQAAGFWPQSHGQAPETDARAAREQERLLELLSAGAEEEELGKVRERWDGKRMAALIRREFGISYLPTSIPPSLRRLGWTPQKPQIRAQQRDEAAIEQFQKE